MSQDSGEDMLKWVARKLGEDKKALRKKLMGCQVRFDLLSEVQRGIPVIFPICPIDCWFLRVWRRLGGQHGVWPVLGGFASRFGAHFAWWSPFSGYDSTVCFSVWLTYFSDSNSSEVYLLYPLFQFSSRAGKSDYGARWHAWYGWSGFCDVAAFVVDRLIDWLVFTCRSVQQSINQSIHSMNLSPQSIMLRLLGIFRVSPSHRSVTTIMVSVFPIADWFRRTILLDLTLRERCKSCGDFFFCYVDIIFFFPKKLVAL